MGLAQLRKAKKLTQQDLAEKVHITRQMISAIENGANPSIDTAKKIAEALGVSVAEIIDVLMEKEIA